MRMAGGVGIEVSGKDAKLQASMRRVGQAFRKNEAAMKRQQAAARRLSKTYKAMQGTLARLAAPATGLLGVAAVKSAVELSRTYADLGAGLKEIAAASNITVEALQELRLAFEADGVSSDKLDKALGRLHKTLGEAPDLSTYRRAYEQIGVDWQDLIAQGADAEQVLMAVADGVRATGDEAKVAASLSQLMGRDWQRFAVVLRKGGAELEKVRKELAQGRTVTEAQATTLKALAQEYKNVADVQRTELAVATAESATGLANMNRLLEAAETLAKDFGLRLAEAAGNLAAVAGLVDGEAAAIGRYEQRIREVDLELNNLDATRRRLAQRMGDPNVTLPGGAAIEYDTLREERDALEAEIARLRRQFNAQGAVTTPGGGGGADTEAGAAFQAEQQRRIDENLLRNARNYKQATDAVAAYRMEQERLAQAQQRAAETAAAGKVDPGLAQAVEMKKAQAAAAEAAKAVQAEWDSAYRGIAETAGQAIGDMVVGFRSLEDTVRSIVSSIIAELTRVAIAKPIAGAIGAAFGLPIGTAATGGDVRRGGLTLVGEQGPEIVDLPAGTRVYPHGMGPGGVTVNLGGITLTNYSSDGPGVQAALAAAAPAIVSAAQEGVMDALRMPGPARSYVFGG